MKHTHNTKRFQVKQRRFLAGRILALLLLFCLSPFSHVFYSMAVMGIYSKMNEKTSLLASENLSLSVPGGLSTLRSD